MEQEGKVLLSYKDNQHLQGIPLVIYLHRLELRLGSITSCLCKWGIFEFENDSAFTDR